MAYWRDKIDWRETDTEIVEGREYSNFELTNIADALLRHDARTELCRVCDEAGEETGEIQAQKQFDEKGKPLTDEQGSELSLEFKEFVCPNNHKWYEGEGRVKGIGGDNPILFEEHFQSRRRREIMTTTGTPDPNIVSGIYNRCVDPLTRALTPTGWKAFDELQVGEKIWTFNKEENACEWQPLKEVFINPEFMGEVQVLESQNLSARVTDGHRWIAVHERDKETLHEVKTNLALPPTKVAHGEDGRFLPNGPHEYLTSRHYIPLAAPPKEVNLESTGREPLFELLGWVLTDGTYRLDKNDALVYQAMHNPKVAALRACLSANELPDEPKYIDENNVGRWAIPVRVGKPLRALTNDIKRIEQVPLEAGTFSELSALLSGIVAGDGCIREATSGYLSREVYSTKKNEADAIQALCSVLGIPSKIRLIENEAAFCPVEYAVNLKKSRWGYIRPAMEENEIHEGVVWCPVVENGFWVAQRDGRVYITGNTHPQGRKVNSPESRKKFGASWYK